MGLVIITVCNPAVGREIQTASAAAYTGRSCFRANWVTQFGWVVVFVPIVAPLPNISAHIENTEFVWRFQSDARGSITAISDVPRDFVDRVATAEF